MQIDAAKEHLDLVARKQGFEYVKESRLKLGNWLISNARAHIYRKDPFDLQIRVFNPSSVSVWAIYKDRGMESVCSMHGLLFKMEDMERFIEALGNPNLLPTCLGMTKKMDFFIERYLKHGGGS